MIRKEVLIVLITFCLTATLFSIIPVGSQGVREYDPWYDINDDGEIDLKDYYGVGLKFGTEGTPFNKTALLDLSNRVSALEKRMNSLKTIRFYTPNETVIEHAQYEDVAVFRWISQNALNNAVLKVSTYFEYSAENALPSGGIGFRVLINGIIVYLGSYEQTAGVYVQTPIAHVFPNLQPNNITYTITVQATLALFGFARVRNINILLEVMDGLPPS